LTYRLVVKLEQIKGRQIALNNQQLHYLLRVLRLGDGDRFIALDGRGNTWLSEIREQSALIIESINIDTELPVSLTLITALPKGNGYEQIIRTILKPSPSKVQRWRKIVSEAAEQSERQIVPHLVTPTQFIPTIEQNTSNQNKDKYICVARGDIPRLWSCLQRQTSSQPPSEILPEIVIATGCEGGWTDREVETAIALGFKPVSLGKRILRAVTAPIVASSIVTAVLEP